MEANEVCIHVRHVENETHTIVDVTDAGEHTEQLSPVNVTEFMIRNTLSLKSSSQFISHRQKRI